MMSLLVSNTPHGSHDAYHKLLRSNIYECYTVGAHITFFKIKNAPVHICNAVRLRRPCRGMGMTRSTSGVHLHQRGKNFRNLFFELPTVLCSPSSFRSLFFVLLSFFVLCPSLHSWQIFLPGRASQNTNILEKSFGVSRKGLTGNPASCIHAECRSETSARLPSAPRISIRDPSLPFWWAAQGARDPFPRKVTFAEDSGRT